MTEGDNGGGAEQITKRSEKERIVRVILWIVFLVMTSSMWLGTPINVNDMFGNSTFYNIIPVFYLLYFLLLIQGWDDIRSQLKQAKKDSAQSSTTS